MSSCMLFTGIISIHVPTRGTTQTFRRYRQRKNYFNPRAHEGHDTTDTLLHW